MAASEEMQTIEPPPPFTINGVAFLITRNAETMLRFSSSITSAPSNISNGFIVPPPTTDTAIAK